MEGGITEIVEYTWRSEDGRLWLGVGCLRAVIACQTSESLSTRYIGCSMNAFPIQKWTLLLLCFVSAFRSES